MIHHITHNDGIIAIAKEFIPYENPDAYTWGVCVLLKKKSIKKNDRFNKYIKNTST